MSDRHITPDRLVRRGRLHEARPLFSQPTWNRIIREEGFHIIRYGQRCSFIDLAEVDAFLTRVAAGEYER